MLYELNKQHEGSTSSSAEYYKYPQPLRISCCIHSKRPHKVSVLQHVFLRATVEEDNELHNKWPKPESLWRRISHKPLRLVYLFNSTDWQFGLCGSQRKPRCATQGWGEHTQTLWGEILTMNGSTEGDLDAKMEKSPAKCVLLMVLTVNGGAQGDCRAPQGSPRSLSTQESDKSKLKQSWWL